MKRTFYSATTKSLSLLSLAGLLTFTACTEDPVNPIEGTPSEEVPATYNFENADYSGQMARIQMLSMLEGKAKEAATAEVSATELNDVFINASGDLFGTNKDIASKTASNAVSEMESYFASIDTLSGNPDNVIDGRIYDQHGVEPAQMIAKGLMGALLYYQATAVYLGDAKMDVDNIEVTEGKGTSMQHHWDEAFGYFGAPTDYLTEEVPEGAEDPAEKRWYWAHYANGRAGVIDANEKIFTAFLEGRTAINNHRIATSNNNEEAAAEALATRDAAIATIRENWERLAAANVVHYVNSAIGDLSANEEGNFFHHWSEGKAFLNTLQHNPAKNITDAELAELNELFGNSPKETDAAKLQQANDQLQQIFGFTIAEMSNL